MTKLFAKQHSSTKKGLPFILPNLALIGDRVREFKVKYTPTPHIQERRHDINVPSYLIVKDEDSKQVLIRGAVWRVKLFYDMKFRDTSLLNYSAQMLYALKVANIKKHNVLNDMYGDVHTSGLNGGKVISYSFRANATKAVENGSATKEQETFHQLYNAPVKPGIDADNVVTGVIRLVKELYDDNDIPAFMRKVVEMWCLGTIHDLDRNRISKIIMQGVRHEVDFKTPEHIVLADKNVIINAFYRAWNIVGDTHDYVFWRMSIEQGSWKWYTDEDDNRRSKWVAKKLDDTKVRYRVNKIRRMLEGKDGRLSSQLPNGLPSLEQKSNQSGDDDLLVLPKNISDELANEIMENASYRHKHMVAFEQNSVKGFHGKAKTKLFKPDERVDKAIRELRKSSSDRGVVPRRMHRMASDRKVFTRKTTVAGGSMMIDCSGSMGLNKDDIKEIVELLPASNVAGYVGYNKKIDGFDGQIEIIAQDGRISNSALDSLSNYGANSVDLDALRWLAEQPEPRIWVSDQQVLGVDEEGRMEYLDNQDRYEISNFMRRNNIIPIEERETVLKVAKQLSLK
mgnify:CR=1 FL=1